VETSFKAAICIVKAGIPHTTAEVLVLQSALDTVETVLGEYTLSKMHVIPLPYNTTNHQISVMTNNVKEQLTNMLKTGKKFIIQVNAN
jgi:hypothetical protein